MATVTKYTLVEQSPDLMLCYGIFRSFDEALSEAMHIISNFARDRHAEAFTCSTIDELEASTGYTFWYSFSEDRSDKTYLFILEAKEEIPGEYSENDYIPEEDI